MGSTPPAFQGIFPSLPTVCTKHGEIDEAGQRSVVRFCIEGGAGGLACLLFAGEFYKFSDAERIRVARVVVDEANGRVPVLVGISHSGTLPSIQLGLGAIDAGADGVIATPPYHANFVKEASASIRRHYQEVAGRLEIPVMIQDYESAGGVRLSAADLEAITRSSGNVRYVKVEGSDHLRRIQESTKLMGDGVGVFGGMGGRYILEELELGARGSIPGAETTDLLVPVYEAARRGDARLAKATLGRLMPYLDYMIRHFDSFVSVEKEVLRRRGVIASSAVREPAIPLDQDALTELAGVLQTMGPGITID
jgi:dihydrodipicolinate synthase/N-acetylneuraminate lyase